MNCTNFNIYNTINYIIKQICEKCTTKLSKNAQQNCKKMHNKIIKKCTIVLRKMIEDVIICGLYNAVVKRTDGIYVLPITALKP